MAMWVGYSGGQGNSEEFKDETTTESVGKADPFRSQNASFLLYP